MNVKGTKRTVFSALFASAICILTLLVAIPSPGGSGYINLGDCFVLLSGALLGPVYGPLASAVGSGLSDVLKGYAVYAPATVISKALSSLFVYLVFKIFKKNTQKVFLASSVPYLIITCSVYFVWEKYIMKYSEAAIANIPANAIQCIISIIIAVALFAPIKKIMSGSDINE